MVTNETLIRYYDRNKNHKGINGYYEWEVKLSKSGREYLKNENYGFLSNVLRCFIKDLNIKEMNPKWINFNPPIIEIKAGKFYVLKMDDFPDLDLVNESYARIWLTGNGKYAKNGKTSSYTIGPVIFLPTLYRGLSKN